MNRGQMISVHMPPELRSLATFGARDQVLAGIVLLALAALLGFAARAARRALAKIPARHPAASLLTFANAALATAVAASGMWQFFADRLHMDVVARVLFFSFMEVTVLTCAALVRQRIREATERARELRARGEEIPLFSAGSPGLMIWVVAGLSGAFSAFAAHSAAEAVFRLAPSPIAAWLWEQCLFTDLRRAGLVTKGQLIVSRILVRLGLAEPEHRSLSDAAALWRLTRLAVAVARAKRAKHLTGFWSWRARSLNVAANQRLGLATSKEHQDTLVALLGSMLGTDTLIALEPPSPWHPATVRHAWKQAQVMPEDVPPAVPEVTLPAPSEHAPGSAAGIPEPVPEARPQVCPKPALKLSASKSRGMTAAQLQPHVLAMLDTYETVSVPKVKADLHVGTDKAAEALRLARAEHGATVTPIDRAARG